MLVEADHWITDVDEKYCVTHNASSLIAFTTFQMALDMIIGLQLQTWDVYERQSFAS